VSRKRHRVSRPDVHIRLDGEVRVIGLARVVAEMNESIGWNNTVRRSGSLTT